MKELSRRLQHVLAVVAAATILTTAAAAPAAAAPTAATRAGGPGSVRVVEAPASLSASATCYAVGLLQTCRTTNVQANASCHCIYAFVSSNGWGNVYDASNGNHVGSRNFRNYSRIPGLYGIYYLEVRNTLGPAAQGILSNVQI